MIGQCVKVEAFKVTRLLGDNAYDVETGLAKDRQIQCFSAEGAVQPLTGRELLQVEEGDRHREHQNIFTACELEDTDTICYKNKNYEVQNIECWNDSQQCIGPYFKVRVVQKDVC